MNGNDILKYGHLTVLHSIDGLADGDWEAGGVCGVWSVKDIMAHLASYEHLLVDVLSGFLEGGKTPYLDQFNDQFNDVQVAERQHLSPQGVLEEYNQTYELAASMAARIPAEKWREPGTLPWYGAEYSLDDYVVYTFYGHKREHTAQIDHFRTG
ncbi:MAG TPA: maleylpyruvate isomerase N-terminal domain-containing protein [Aggregatilineaceae bacterium]|nr:maleylpyruvate isomerase N-terminal domain-containing protein [Aggregatilineaceae bacterium]